GSSRTVGDKASLPSPNGAGDANLSRYFIYRLNFDWINDLKIFNSRQWLSGENRLCRFPDDTRLSFALFDHFAREHKRSEQDRRCRALRLIQISVAGTQGQTIHIS